MSPHLRHARSLCASVSGSSSGGGGVVPTASASQTSRAHHVKAIPGWAASSPFGMISAADEPSRAPEADRVVDHGVLDRALQAGSTRDLGALPRVSERGRQIASVLERGQVVQRAGQREGEVVLSSDPGRALEQDGAAVVGAEVVVPRAQGTQCCRDGLGFVEGLSQDEHLSRVLDLGLGLPQVGVGLPEGASQLEPGALRPGHAVDPRHLGSAMATAAAALLPRVE